MYDVGTAHEAKALFGTAPVRNVSGIGRATADKLDALGLGVQTCGEVLAVPLATLRKEFGDEMSRQITCLAQGHDFKPAQFDVWKVVHEASAHSPYYYRIIAMAVCVCVRARVAGQGAVGGGRWAVGVHGVGTAGMHCTGD